MASRDPVEAPEGTEARPMAPDSSNTSHSTVGLPRESRISRPMISTIALMVVDCPAKKEGCGPTAADLKTGEKPDCTVQNIPRALTSAEGRQQIAYRDATRDRPGKIKPVPRGNKKRASQAA